MAMSTFQTVTLATCLVLCVGLLLPKLLLSRGRKDAAERPEGSGRFPPMMHRQSAPEGRSQRAASAGYSRAHNSEAVAKAKGAGAGSGSGGGGGGKSNLAGQIIPVYGFGILLYILYILFKITSKGGSKASEGRFPSVRSENMKRKITDFELTQLQEKLRETELVMENMVSSVQDGPDRVQGVMADQEESLLQQLTEITRVMREGQLVDGVTEEKKRQDDWGDDPEEPQGPSWEPSRCCCQHSGHFHGPQTQTDSEAAKTPTAAAAANEEEEDQLMENVPEEEVGGAAEETQAPDPAAARVSDEEDEPDLGVPEEEELVGILKELELTLKVTTVMEQEETEDTARPLETEGVQVRRRNKRRRVKKATH